MEIKCPPINVPTAQLKTVTLKETEDPRSQYFPSHCSLNKININVLFISFINSY